MTRALLVWVRDRPGTPLPAAERAVGRAGMALSTGDVPVVFGQRIAAGRATGLRVGTDGSWEPVDDMAIGAVAMRFPRRSYPDLYREGLAGIRAADWTIPIVNTPMFSDLTADKLATQHALMPVVDMPAMEIDAAAFSARLMEWGTAFLKPRFGSKGEGVVRLTAGDAIPQATAGEVLLQRAVEPPSGWAGISLRVLVQREGDGWTVPTIVARTSRDDPTVAVARGAEVVAARTVVGAKTLDVVYQRTETIARRLGDQGPWDPEDVVEMGVDFALDVDGKPWCLEVNSIPRGRLRALAVREPSLQAEHEAAVRRPLERILRRIDE